MSLGYKNNERSFIEAIKSKCEGFSVSAEHTLAMMVWW